ncbi:hypothetical protein LA52FAK_04950 [Desulforhopalus sp. 52FAK]
MPSQSDHSIKPQGTGITQLAGQRHPEIIEGSILTCPEEVDEQIYKAMLDDPRYVHCIPIYESQDTPKGNGPKAPVTRGRRYDTAAPWNVWVNPKALKTVDERYGRNIDSDGVSVNLGADKHFRDGWLTGFWMSLMNNETTGFRSLVETESDGFKIGPYIGKSITDHWALSTFFSYGRFDNSSKLLILEGDYNSEEYSLLINANGYYTLSDDGRTRIQPSVSISYTHTRTDDYTLHGEVFDIPLDLDIENADANSGVASVTAEFSHTFSLEKSTTESVPTTEPFFELGVSYEYERPNDGKILTGEFTYKTPSAWSGSVRTGLRSRVTDSIYIEASLGYLSIGQSDYDEWEGALYLSYSF